MNAVEETNIELYAPSQQTRHSQTRTLTHTQLKNIPIKKSNRNKLTKKFLWTH